MADFSAEDLQKAIKDILKGADLDSLSTKKIRKMLGKKYDVDFSHRKREIDKIVMEMITENDKEEQRGSDEEDEKASGEDNENGGAAENDSNDDISEEEEVPKKKAKKSSSKASKTAKRRSAGKADDSEDPVMSSIKQMDDEDLAKKLQEEESGFRRRGAKRAAAPRPKPRKEKERDPEKKKKPSHYSRPCHLSDQLATVVGTNEMPRSEVVKSLWSIVKERNLQDPGNKQFMLCDEQMETLFGAKRIRLFGMMKYLKKHITDPSQ